MAWGGEGLHPGVDVVIFKPPVMGGSRPRPMVDVMSLPPGRYLRPGVQCARL